MSEKNNTIAQLEAMLFAAGDPVEPEKLERVLEAARLAPSACNAQPWRFVVITDKELAQKAGKAAAGLGMNKFAKDAPVHILVVEESANITSLLGGKVKGKHFPLIDIGIAADLLNHRLPD